MTVGERIKAARIAAGFTQAQLAKRLGIAYQNIGQWESGKRVPGLDSIFKIATALHVHPCKLAFGNCWILQSADKETAHADD